MDLGPFRDARYSNIQINLSGISSSDQKLKYLYTLKFIRNEFEQMKTVGLSVLKLHKTYWYIQPDLILNMSRNVHIVRQT